MVFTCYLKKLLSYSHWPWAFMPWQCNQPIC